MHQLTEFSNSNPYEGIASRLFDQSDKFICVHVYNVKINSRCHTSASNSMDNLAECMTLD